MKVSNPIGLSFEFLENGAVKSMDAGSIRLNLKQGNPFAKPGMNLYLRKRSNPIEFKALLGSESESKFAFIDNTYIAKGNWNGLEYTCLLQLSEKSNSWKWTVKVTNTTLDSVDLDCIYMQEVGLKTAHEGLVNEYYVSQYLERLILTDEKHGAVVACRQNMKEACGNPWMMIASAGKSLAASTDGMQFYGNSYRETGIPEALMSEELKGNFAGESPVVALQEKPFRLSPDENTEIGFVGTYIADHQKATSIEDVKIIDEILTEFSTPQIDNEKISWKESAKNIFNTSKFLPCEDLTESELKDFFGTDFRHIEKVDGKMLSFFTGLNNHLVLKQKETLVDRPHAHILQAKIGTLPDENTMSTTCFATGIFNSHISQGNTNFNVFLSINTSQFNLNLESGQRIFVEIDGTYHLLGIPSAFEMGLNFCRWIYKHETHWFEIITRTSISSPVIELEYKVLRGNSVKLFVTQHFDNTNVWNITKGKSNNEFIGIPSENSMILSKFPEATFSIEINDNQSFSNSLDKDFSQVFNGIDSRMFVLDVPATSHFSMSFVGQVCESFEYKSHIDNDSHSTAGTKYWEDLSNKLALNSSEKNLKAINEILPWYGMNAMTHYLTPYGLEQFSGAAWGTRDVSQGPIEFLLSLEKYDAAREVLLTIFSNQNPAADWPQWWMFDSYSHIRAGDCHGDVYYWVIIALASYIKVTGDVSVLKEEVPYFGDNSVKTPVSEHIDRLVKMIVDSYVSGTSLVPFGGGDWNDSLQPFNEELAKRLISSWTVEMNYQAFSQFKDVYDITGDTKKAQELNQIAENIKLDFNKYLVKDGIVAGYGYVENDGSISVLLHPNDEKTGIKYSLLPMDRGIISGIFTKEQALSHQILIDKYLKGPDGARLMDKPLKYKGGIQEIFQRAESSPYFGREIGLMYIHEHIRYAESQAVLGKAESFIKALRQAIPVEYKEWVPISNLRQSNCYYTSSDVAFKTRYEADEKYQDVLDGKVTVNAGWRVYSSGPGIYVSLIIKKLLGFRVEKNQLMIDPVLTKDMNGLTAHITFKGYSLNLNYNIQTDNFSPKDIEINGQKISFTEEQNPYRKGGAVLAINDFVKLLNHQENTIKITL